MSNRTQWARSLIERTETSNPGIVQLASLASLAVRIEPELLRSLRLALAPGLSAAAEADLWFSPLVRSRGPDGIVIVPEVATVLRKRLARETLRRAWAITEDLHRYASPALRLEEKCAWLPLSGRPDWKEQVERELNSALRALLVEKRSGVARWALRALPQLPEEVCQISAAWKLKLATERETGRRVQLKSAPPADLFEADLSEILTGMAEVELGVKREGDELLLGDVHGKGAFAILVPDTDPRLIEVRWDVWEEGAGAAWGTAPLGAGPIGGGMVTSGEKRELVSVPPGKVVRKWLGSGTLHLRTPSGDVYQLDDDTTQHDPIGFQIFKVLQSAVRLAVRGGELRVLSGDEKVRNDTVLGFEDGMEALGRRRGELPSVVARWNDDLLPDLVTSRGRGQREVVHRLQKRLPDLRREGIVTFRFKDLVDPMKADVRARWAALLAFDFGESVPREGSVEGGKAIRFVEPDYSVEERELFHKLVDCVLTSLRRLQVDAKTREYLGTLWQFLNIQASEGMEKAAVSRLDRALQAEFETTDEERPSLRKLAEQLQIPRERLPSLYKTLGELLEECRAANSGKTAIARLKLKRKSTHGGKL